MLDYLASRLQEPSTWVSLGSLFTGLGFVIAPDYWQAIAGIGMCLGGLMGTILRERKKTSAVEMKSVVEAMVVTQALEPVYPTVLELTVRMKEAIVAEKNATKPL